MKLTREQLMQALADYRPEQPSLGMLDVFPARIEPPTRTEAWDFDDVPRWGVYAHIVVLPGVVTPEGQEASRRVAERMRQACVEAVERDLGYHRRVSVTTEHVDAIDVGEDESNRAPSKITLDATLRRVVISDHRLRGNHSSPNQETTMRTEQQLFDILARELPGEVIRAKLLEVLADAFAVVADFEDEDEAQEAVRGLLEQCMDGACFEADLAEAAGFVLIESRDWGGRWACGELQIIEANGAWDWLPANCRRHCWEGCGCDCDEVDAREDAEAAAQARHDALVDEE